MFRQDRTNPSTAVSNWKGRSNTPQGWPSTRVSTWLNGGLFGAAAGADGFEKIGSTDAGGTTTVTFTGIDSTKYQTYMVVWKTTQTYLALENRLRLNGTDSSSGNIYQSNWFYVSNTTAWSSNDNAETYPKLGGIPKNGSYDDQIFSQSWISGPSLASTGKPMYQFWGSLHGGSDIRNGLAYNTAFTTTELLNATTEITVNAEADSTNFPTGTIVSCYGYRLAT